MKVLIIAYEQQPIRKIIMKGGRQRSPELDTARFKVFLFLYLWLGARHLDSVGILSLDVNEGLLAS